MKLVNTKHQPGQKMILPVVGNVTLDEKSQVDVPESLAEQLLEGTEWELADPKAAAKKGTTTKKPALVPAAPAKVEGSEGNQPGSDTSDGAGSEEETEEVETTPEEMIELINKMSHAEMLETAQASKIKGWQFFKTEDKAEGLRNLIIKHIQKQQ